MRVQWMNVLRRTALCLVGAVATISSNSQTYDPNLHVRIRIEGKLIDGTREYTSRNSSPTLASLLRIRRGSSHQIHVDLVSKSPPKVTDVTGSSKVRYDAFGCLQISATGLMTVKANADCGGPDYPSLFVYYSDNSAKIVTYNDYLFVVTD